jgi:hypothetical protein
VRTFVGFDGFLNFEEFVPKHSFGGTSCVPKCNLGTRGTAQVWGSALEVVFWLFLIGGSRTAIEPMAATLSRSGTAFSGNFACRFIRSS